MSPWIARNYRLAGEFIPVGTVLGPAMFQGFYVNQHFRSDKPHYQLLGEASDEQERMAREAGMEFKGGFFQTFYDAKDEVKQSKALQRFVFREYGESPTLFMKNVLLNFMQFWFQGRTPTATLLNIIVVTPMLILFIFGVWTTLRRKEVDLSVMALLVLSIVASDLLVVAHARHQVPLIPFLLLFVSLAVLRLTRWGAPGSLPRQGSRTGARSR